MDWKDLGQDVLDTVRDAAPGVAEALVGVAAGPRAARLAGNALAKVLGVEASPQAIQDAIKNDPEAHLKLRQAEMAYELEKDRIDLERERDRLKDVASAREREARIVAVTKKRDVMMGFLVTVAMLGFFTEIFWLLHSGLPKNITPGEGALIGSLLTVPGTLVVTIFTYYFGSSKGSSDKTKLLVKEN